MDSLLETAELAQEAYERPRGIGEILKANYPPTEWVWQDFILKGEVNLLYGDGGVGKSLLALHLAINVALGEPLFEHRTMEMSVLALFAEDGESEVHRRAHQIYEDLDLHPKEPLPIHLWCQPKDDTLLAVIEETGEIREQPRLQMLRTELQRLGEPALIILDSLADLFAMNESLRLPVNAALKRVLGKLCRDYGATVLVLAHPSKTSMLDGSKYSGSTAFNNAVRQRLTLEFAKVDKDAVIEGSRPRTLSVAKSNYGSNADAHLWFYGYSIQVTPKENKLSELHERKAVLRAMLLLIDEGVRVIKRNGQAGDAKTLKEFADTIYNKHDVRILWKRAQKHLNYLCDTGQLTYRESNKSVRPHVKARYERGPKCIT